MAIRLLSLLLARPGGGHGRGGGGRALARPSADSLSGISLSLSLPSRKPEAAPREEDDHDAQLGGRNLSHLRQRRRAPSGGLARLLPAATVPPSLPPYS